MRKSLSIWALAACAAAVFCVMTVVWAQTDGDWIVRDFSGDIEIRQDGSILVTERINADFDGVAKHGIYRDMPFAYREPDGSTSYTAVAVDEVLQDGSPAQYAIERNANNLRIRIGDPDRTIVGRHAYELRYTVQGALREYADYDELYWNVTGNEWGVPIERSFAVIRFPEGAIEQASCYIGPEGSTARCGSMTYDASASAVRFEEQEPLLAYSGLTIAVGFPKGLVPVVHPDKYTALGATPYGLPVAGISALAVLLVGFMIVLYEWWRWGRDKWFVRDAASRIGAAEADAAEEVMPLGAHETIMAEYDPPSPEASAGDARPKPLRPAEIGVLKDETADTLDVSATIVDLAVRGYIEITEIPKKWLFGKVDYELKRKKQADMDLMPYESTLLVELFSDAEGDAVRISELREKFYTKLRIVKELLYEEVVRKKYFTKAPNTVRGRWYVAGGVLIAAGIWGTIAAAGNQLLFPNVFAAAGLGALAGCLPLGVIVTIAGRFAMLQRTAKGRELYRKIRGYELYLQHVEQYRQQFFEREGTFRDVLPYVIVFGLTERIAKATEAMGAHPPQPAWYHGNYAAFNVAAFSDSMTSFSSSLSSAIASVPGGSGSGGGGFSGGGGGGGGGGSW